MSQSQAQSQIKGEEEDNPFEKMGKALGTFFSDFLPPAPAETLPETAQPDRAQQISRNEVYAAQYRELAAATALLGSEFESESTAEPEATATTTKPQTSSLLAALAEADAVEAAKNVSAPPVAQRRPSQLLTALAEADAVEAAGAVAPAPSFTLPPHIAAPALAPASAPAMAPIRSTTTTAPASAPAAAPTSPPSRSASNTASSPQQSSARSPQQSNTRSPQQSSTRSPQQSNVRRSATDERWKLSPSERVRQEILGKRHVSQEAMTKVYETVLLASLAETEASAAAMLERNDEEWGAKLGEHVSRNAALRVEVKQAKRRITQLEQEVKRLEAELEQTAKIASAAILQPVQRATQPVTPTTPSLPEAPDEPELPELPEGSRAYFTSFDGTRKVVKVVKVHYDDDQPYYTISMDGIERSTLRKSLEPILDVRAFDDFEEHERQLELNELRQIDAQLSPGSGLASPRTPKHALATPAMASLNAGYDMGEAKASPPPKMPPYPAKRSQPTAALKAGSAPAVVQTPSSVASELDESPKPAKRRSFLRRLSLTTRSFKTLEIKPSFAAFPKSRRSSHA